MNVINDFQQDKLDIDGKKMFDKIEEINKRAKDIYQDIL